MVRKIKLYGGVLHGETHAADQYATRIEVNIPHRARANFLRPYQIDLMDIQVPRRQSYTIEIFREAVGRMERETWIAVIDGAKNLTEEERWEIERDLSRLPWVPTRAPSILNEFESWWNQTLYRHTGYESYLYPEFERR